MADDRALRGVIHDIRNQLAIAVAHLEAYTDGKLAPTPERLQRVLEAVNEANALLDRLREVVASGEA
jgi:hypothetical protein